MSRRSGPASVGLAILLALPFVAIGGFACWVGFAKLAAGSLLGLVTVAFGLVFVGAGVWQVVHARRLTRSAEARALTARKGPPADGDALPIVRGRGEPGYRIAPGVGAPARQAYGAALDRAPLPKVEVRPGRTLRWSLGLRPESLRSEIFFAVVWNVFVLPLVFSAARARAWVPTLFLLLFLVVGVYLILTPLRRWLARRKLPRVEISDEPVYLGAEAGIHVEQRGPARILSYRVSLVCREQVSYTVGTDTRTETHDALDEVLVEEGGFRLGLNERWTRDFTVEVPAYAPPSFAAEHNSVEWMIRVRAEIDGWPDYEEDFAFRALPRLGP